MEKVLDTYRKECADDEVLVRMDETSKQVVGEVVTSVPDRPGIHDFEYFRDGVSSLFVSMPRRKPVARDGDGSPYAAGLGPADPSAGRRGFSGPAYHPGDG